LGAKKGLFLGKEKGEIGRLRGEVLVGDGGCKLREALGGGGRKFGKRNNGSS